MRTSSCALKRLALIALCAAPLAAQAPPKPDLLWEKMTAQVTAIAQHLDGVMGVSVVDLTDGRSFALNAEQVFATASTIKLPLLIELYRQEQAGRAGTSGVARLADRYTFDPADLVEESDIMAGLTPGVSVVTNHDLAQFMVAVSDNAATNVLIRRVGMDRVNAMLRSQGLTQTLLRRKMIDLAAARRGDENVASPADMTRLLGSLFHGKLLDSTLTAALLTQLSTGKKSYLPRDLPGDLRIANKPGWLDGVRADVGIIYAARRPFAISVMTAYVRDERAAELAIGNVALVAYRYFEMLGKASPYGRVMP
jgi:beta-lactamase class A